MPENQVISQTQTNLLDPRIEDANARLLASVQGTPASTVDGVTTPGIPG
jgi:hypothetical protein